MPIILEMGRPKCGREVSWLRLLLLRPRKAQPSKSTQPCVHQWFDRAPASESGICGSQTLSLPKTAKYARRRITLQAGRRWPLRSPRLCLSLERWQLPLCHSPSSFDHHSVNHRVVEFFQSWLLLHPGSASGQNLSHGLFGPTGSNPSCSSSSNHSFVSVSV
jgi:hypothetical protein